MPTRAVAICLAMLGCGGVTVEEEPAGVPMAAEVGFVDVAVLGVRLERCVSSETGRNVVDVIIRTDAAGPIAVHFQHWPVGFESTNSEPAEDGAYEFVVTSFPELPNGTHDYGVCASRAGYTDCDATVVTVDCGG